MTPRAPFTALGLTALVCGTLSGGHAVLGRDEPTPPAEAVSPAAGSIAPEALRMPRRNRPSGRTPLRDYMLTETQVAAMSFARSTLIRECMNARGHDFPVPDLAATRTALESSAEVDATRMFGITDLSQARQFGYAPPPSTSQASLKLSSDHDYWQALMGDGGCVPQADAHLLLEPDISTYGRARDVLVTVLEQTLETPAALAAVADWRRCMRSHGHRVTSPVADEGDIAALFSARPKDGGESPRRPSDDEIALAVDDISCKHDVDLVARLERERTVLERAAVTELAPSLMADRERLDLQLSRVRQVLRRQTDGVDGNRPKRISPHSL